MLPTPLSLVVTCQLPLPLKKCMIQELMKEQRGLPVTLPTQVTICSKNLPLARSVRPLVTSAASSQELSPCLTSPAPHCSSLSASTLYDHQTGPQHPTGSEHAYCEHVYYHPISLLYPSSIGIMLHFLGKRGVGLNTVYHIFCY